MINFSELKPAITTQDIDKVESIVNLTFPSEYKKHLIRFNGGRCEPNTFTFYENGELTASCIDWFLAIYDGKYHNMVEYIQTYKIDEKRMPNHMLPIAHDPGGNLICLSCSPTDYGHVYFWNHDDEVDYNFSDDTDYTNLYLISGSFNDFLESLTEE